MSASSMLAASRWVVMGDVLNSAKPASRIVRRLMDHNKTVHLVNPRAPSAAGASPVVHPSLSGLLKDTQVDVVDVVINPVDGLKQLSAVPASSPPLSIFIQPGAGSDEIRNLCKERKWPVHEGCVLVEMKSKM